MKLVMMKGLPASGKSTYAKALSGYKRINRDDLRLMVDDGKFSGKKEKFIKKSRDSLVRLALEMGVDVVVDDTNLHPSNEQALMEIAKEFGATFEIVDFTDVDPYVCIKRDLNRSRSVGESVIWKMYDEFIVPGKEKFVPKQENPECVIVDVDGTLALHRHRGPFEFEKCGTDELNEIVATVVKILAKEYPIVIASARPDTCKDETIKWLLGNGINFVDIYMRSADDNRKDCIVKSEMLDRIAMMWNPVLVLDDRDQTVRTWREKGIPCFQVAEGNF